MNESLGPEVLPPPHTHLARMIAASVACGVTAVAVAVAVSSTPVHASLVPPVAVQMAETSIAVPVTAAAREVAPAPPSTELLFVFEDAGATYAKLASLDAGKLPKHGAPKLVDRDGSAVVIAPIAAADLPVEHRARVGGKLRVDDRCTATITGFAIVSRLTGDPGYAGIEAPNWTVDTALASGDTVLAARLDGCKGGTYARDAALPAIVVPAEIRDGELADAARSALLASTAAKETQEQWVESGGEGAWYDHVELDVKVVRHPTTHVTWIVAHGVYTETSCGGPTANVLGLFRVKPDRTIVPVGVHRSEVFGLEKIIDVDGDGDLELIGRPWLGLNVQLLDARTQELLDELKLPFYGCPC